MIRKIYLQIASCAALLCVSGAYATTTSSTYTFNTNEITDGSGSLNYSTGWYNGRASITGSDGGTGRISATVSAWQLNDSGVATEISDYLYGWDLGFGVAQPDSTNNGAPYSTEDAPWHAVDNNPDDCSTGSSTHYYCDNAGAMQGAFTGEEFLLFDFGPDHEVELDSFLFGYARENGSARADATVMRSGSGGDQTGLNIAYDDGNSTLNIGFELVGNYDDVADADLSSTSSIQNSAQSVDGSGTSRFWAVSTLLTNLPLLSIDDNAHFDAAKLAQIVVTKTTTTHNPPPPTGVSAPATALLLAAWFLGGSPRRRARAVLAA